MIPSKHIPLDMDQCFLHLEDTTWWQTHSCWIAEAELIASLPRYMVAPTSFNEWVGLGVYDVFGSSAQERGAGSIVTHQVLHVPGGSVAL